MHGASTGTPHFPGQVQAKFQLDSGLDFELAIFGSAASRNGWSMRGLHHPIMAPIAPDLFRKNMSTSNAIGLRAVYRLVLVSAVLALSACSAEVAGGAAAVGALQAEQASQAQAQQARVVDAFKAAQEAGAARAASAAD